MAIKTFTAGSVLTASDTNTYLANAGLVYITSGSLSGTSKNFEGCFTSTYDNYRIVFSSVQTSNGADIYYSLLNGTTPATSADYTYAYLGYRVDGIATNSQNGGTTAGYTGMTQSGVNNTPVMSGVMDFYSPKLSQRTFATSMGIGYSGNWYTRTGMTHFNLTTSFDGIQFNTQSAPTMGGTVTIYGYRKL